MNVIQRGLRRVDAFQQRHDKLAFVVGVQKKYGDDNAGSLAVQMTYSMFVTVFPLLLLLITVLGIVLANDPSARHRVLSSAFGQFPIAGKDLASNVHAMRRSSVFGLVIGIGGLIYGSTGLAQSGMYAMEQIWNIPSVKRPNFLTRLGRSLVFLLILAVGLVLTTALSGFGTFGRHSVVLGVLGEALAAALNVGIYLAAFRALTPKSVGTRLLVPGAVLGGVLWTVLQAFGGYVVGHDLKGSSAIYGMFGLVLGLIAWIYLGVEMTLYCVEVNAVRHLRLWPRALVQPPLTEADQRSLARQATENQRRPEQVIETRFDTRPMTQDEYKSRGYVADDDSPGVHARAPEPEPLEPGKDPAAASPKRARS